MTASTLLASEFAELEVARARSETLAEQHTQVLEEWDSYRTEFIRGVTLVEDWHDRIARAVEPKVEAHDLFRVVFEGICDLLKSNLTLYRRVENGPPSQAQRRIAGELLADVERLAELVRAMAVTRPDLVDLMPAIIQPVVFTLRVGPLAYIRAMANLLWSAIRHPLSETTIDLSTGRVLYRN